MKAGTNSLRRRLLAGSLPLALLAILSGWAPASAQPDNHRPARPTAGMGSKTMESCKADAGRYCAGASNAMQKECLVRNWTRISNDCQDAVGSPGRGPAGAAE